MVNLCTASFVDFTLDLSGASVVELCPRKSDGLLDGKLVHLLLIGVVEREHIANRCVLEILGDVFGDRKPALFLHFIIIIFFFLKKKKFSASCKVLEKSHLEFCQVKVQLGVIKALNGGGRVGKVGDPLLDFKLFDAVDHFVGIYEESMSTRGTHQ